MKAPHRNYRIMRMFVRLNEQAVTAHQYGREADAFAIGKLIGRLEVLHYGFVSAWSGLDE